MKINKICKRVKNVENYFDDSILSVDCSEIAMGIDSCRLIANNMYSCVINPFEVNSYFDYEKWYEVCYESQRLMDDLVDLELESIEKIFEKIENDSEPDYIKDVEKRTWKTLYENGKKGRRTGLGFTALGDTVAALNLKYDSIESLEIVEKIMKKKCEAEFDSSIDMSIERGSFVGFDPKIENTSDFVKMLENELPEVYRRMMKYGRRNISVSTIAPTGSLSILTQTTSGIEPVFMTSYTRRRKVTDNEKYDFQDDMGDKWEENKVYHPKLKTFIEITGKKEEESPYIGCSANELDWKKRVDMQSICQKFTTHSISSTINLKQDVPESLIDEIYMRSWEKGLKGVTVYREGSRSGVLVSNDKKSVDDIIKENNAPRRPKNMECDVMRFTNKGERWIGFVGLLNGVPYEAFTGLLDAFPVPGYVEKGVVRKTKDDEGVSRYDFIYKDKDGYEMMMGGLSRAFNREYWNYGKLVSAILRHGMPIPNIINTLDSLNIGDGDTIGTWKAGVKRMLKRYIKDGVKVGETCPNCGKDTLIYQNGCVQCTNIDCTYSKCE